jgi:LmbE family N-acetylglucosaminyl deacetylase
MAFALVACLPPHLPAGGGSAIPVRTDAQPSAQLSLEANDRILILAPHPDDETLATGGITQKAVAAGLPVRIVYLTNGDANQWSFALYRKRPEVGARAVESMGEVRRSEAISATRTLGLRPDQIVFLGYPDFGNLQIWVRHWGASPPYRGLLTGATAVPYPDAYRPGAAYRGEEVLHDIEKTISDFKPTKIFLSHPADQNPDHVALYLFTRVALWNLAAQVRPEVYPYLVHYPRWPEPRGEHTDLALTPPAALAGDVDWLTEPLNPGEFDIKRSALQQHKTQYEANRRYLDSFLRINELFGDMPPVRLEPGAVEVNVSQRALLNGRRAGEQLTEEERARFVGLEARTVRLEGTDLVFSMEFSSPLGNGVEASAYLFGYRPDLPFAQMPKLHVKFSDIGRQVYDGQEELPPSAVTVVREPRKISLRVPVELLGSPERVLFSGRTYLGDVPLDSIEWRVLSLPAGSG